MADLVEIAAVHVKDGKITDRWSTLVNPGRPIIGNQMHGINDADVKKAPTPAEAAKQAVAFIGDAPIVGHSVGFDLGFLEAALADGTHFEQGRYLDTLAIAREGYPDLENYKLRDAVALLRHRARAGAPRPAGRRGDRQPADLVRQRPAGSHRGAQGRPGRLVPGATGPVATAKALQEAARREARVSKSLYSLIFKKTARQLALDEGVRMDGRGVTELRPISVEVGLLPRAHGSGLFTPR